MKVYIFHLFLDIYIFGQNQWPWGWKLRKLESYERQNNTLLVFGNFMGLLTISKIYNITASSFKQENDIYHLVSHSFPVLVSNILYNSHNVKQMSCIITGLSVLNNLLYHVTSKALFSFHIFLDLMHSLKLLSVGIMKKDQQAKMEINLTPTYSS